MKHPSAGVNPEYGDSSDTRGGQECFALFGTGRGGAGPHYERHVVRQVGTEMVNLRQMNANVRAISARAESAIGNSETDSSGHAA